MRKIVISILLIIGAFINANAATSRGSGAAVERSGVARSSVSPARSAVSARSATRSPSVVSRAATTQKVINSGTKVATAAKNTAVSEECQNKYYGCMDAFCMLDNTSGGRCVCSNRNAELDEILAEIEKLDQQSYQMATYGVEKIEMGDDAEAAIAKANAAAAEAMENVDGKNSRRKSLDLSMWNTDIDLDDVDAFDIFATSESTVDGKTGDALQRAASDLCVAQIPECGAEMSMLKLLYAQKIKSDCNAYENSLKQQKNASQTKLATAERALRDAALEQLRAANKYDLGQCTIQFKKCMQTTGGCGDDFSSCATVAAFDSTNVRQSTSKKAKNYSIKGSATTIEISASTYDTLLAKKPLCETVTKQCKSVADQVWETFLKEVAPAIKSAEIIAEDNLRQNCIGNISQCFQKACRDNIDPNDPDGSYDMCLTRPQTMLNVCRVPLNACGIKEKTPEESEIWDFVVARLASMRVDSCTKEVKQCLQSEDRCGKDYTQCVGLDTDTIMRMCPYEKLVGCQYKNGGDTRADEDSVYQEVYRLVKGVMLNIDNNMLTMCQRAADEAMIKVCGDTEDCNAFAVDDGVGTRSLKSEFCPYNKDNKKLDDKKCLVSLDGVSNDEIKRLYEDGGYFSYDLTGLVYWGDIEYSCAVEDDDNQDEEAKVSNTTGAEEVLECKFTTEPEYIERLKSAGVNTTNLDEDIIKNRVFGMEIRALTNSVNSAVNAIESDPTVQYCTSGRRVQGMKFDGGEDDGSFGQRGRGSGRFPNLTVQMRKTIALAALRTARENYNKKYDEELSNMKQEQIRAAERLDKAKAIEDANTACVNWAKESELPKSKAPQTNIQSRFIGSALSTAAAILFGIPFFAIDGVKQISDPVGESNAEDWNYKESVKTMFNSTTGVCTKVTKTQNCKKTKKNYCDEWEEPKETITEVKLL